MFPDNIYNSKCKENQNEVNIKDSDSIIACFSCGLLRCKRPINQISTHVIVQKQVATQAESRVNITISK